MRKNLKLLTAMVFSLALLNTACRSEESELIEAPQNESLEANSRIADLLQRTALNDGSDDNIIDNASCLDIELPVTVNVNGLDIIVDSEEDLELIEDIFDEFDDDIDELEILFPITIVLADFTEVTINNFDELEDLAEDCAGENEDDDDIECADIQYPVEASIFDTNEELIGTISIDDDKELYLFIEDLDDTEIVTIGFPISVMLSDGTVIEASNLDDLEEILDNADDDCDEDDDNDYNDDDCENCNTELLTDVLTSCDDWYVDKLERNDMDLEDEYTGFFFSFTESGDIEVTDGVDIFQGSWMSDGTGSNIVVTINVPELPDFNDEWMLHEIEQEGDDNQVDLRIGDDRLRFESDCQ
ncbi:MAG: hypothetical protein ABF293_01115 [Flavobacteriaceae bacterium]